MRINKEENIQASEKGLPITAVFVVVVATKEVDEGVVRPKTEARRKFPLKWPKLSEIDQSD